MTADLISYHFTRSAFFRRAEAPQSGPRSRAIQPSIIITRLNSGSQTAWLGGGSSNSRAARPRWQPFTAKLPSPKRPVRDKPTGPIRPSNRAVRAVSPPPSPWSVANPASAFLLSLGPSGDKSPPRHPRPPATASPNGGASIPGPPPTPPVPSGAAGSTITSRQRIKVDVFERHPRAMLAVLTGGDR